MKKISISILTIIISLNVQGVTNKGSYSLTDLEILAKEKSFLEYFAHAHDIKPSQRTKQWETWTQSLSLEYIKELEKLSTGAVSELKQLREISNWPVLADNEFFISRRDTFFINWLKKCLVKGKHNCKAQALKFHNNHNHDPVFGLNLLVQLNTSNLSRNEKIGLVSSLVKSNIGEFYCNKSPLKEHIIQEILLSEIASLKEKYHQSCITSLKTTLSSKLYLANREKMYQVLEQFQLIDPELKIKYNILTLLNNNQISLNSLESSIENLKVLAQNPEARSNLIQSFKKEELFPGRIFRQSDKKTSAKARLISRYFPEFIQEYGQTCIQYLSGKKIFTNGSPTPECHQFFKTSIANDLLSSALIKSYRQSTYFMK